jgi:hypothetical protein
LDKDTELFDSSRVYRRSAVQKESLCSDVERYDGLKLLVESASESTLAELAEIMRKISDMIHEHPELLCQTPSERMNAVLSALQQL